MKTSKAGQLHNAIHCAILPFLDFKKILHIYAQLRQGRRHGFDRTGAHFKILVTVLQLGGGASLYLKNKDSNDNIKIESGH